MPAETTSLTRDSVKRALSDAGFVVFRTQGNDVVIAERVRENLIMDSGVRLRAGSPLQVRVVLKAQRGDFPADDEGHLFDRVRQLAAPALSGGFREVDQSVVPIQDPASGNTLDTFYEIVLAKDAEALEGALEGVRFALTLDKMVARKG